MTRPVETVIGFVGGRPVGRDLLDRRIAELRDGPSAAALPAPGTAEDRQLARWLTQVILTETLCEAEARARGLPPEPSESLDREPALASEAAGPLGRVAAVELGSVNAAAYAGSPWVRAMFAHVAATAAIPAGWVPGGRAGPVEVCHLVSHRLFPSRAEAVRARADELEPLGEVTLESLPSALAAALRSNPYGTLTGPVRDALGWHVAVASAQLDQPPERTPEAPVGAARRLAFARWLDEQRAAQVELVPGLEHPGDPRQPDNHHKH
ncbi:DUF7158 domain-containing protein [Nonomuraea sp. SBT364]|uniref:DUF7158 domain-containing protein n=1 Tax=Nonomuraea sp. SBT364 TaxID=1580530 RepID=UPI00066D161D|nr:hypothetical protein [Nonomuraea sp. SBT364]